MTHHLISFNSLPHLQGDYLNTLANHTRLAVESCSEDLLHLLLYIYFFRSMAPTVAMKAQACLYSLPYYYLGGS